MSITTVTLQTKSKMFSYFYLTTLTSFLIFFLIFVIILVVLEKHLRKNEIVSFGQPEPPTPKFSLPIVGHLHLLGGYEVPYQAFTALGKKFGNVVKLRLGYVDSVVINGQETIREVLVTKGHHFDSRPSFERYQQLFGGDKQNCKYNRSRRSIKS